MHVENAVRVLLSEKQTDIVSLLTLLLSEIKECRLDVCQPSELLVRIGASRYGLVLLSSSDRPDESLEILQKIRHLDPGVYVIFSLPNELENYCDNFMKAGAHDCVVKNRNYVPNIVSSVKKALIRIAEREAFEVPILARAQRFAMDENLPDIIFSLDLYGRILYVNQAISLLGHEQTETVGKDFCDFIAGESARNTFLHYLNTVYQNITFREMLPLLTRNGQEQNFDINFTLMEGEIIYGVAHKESVPEQAAEPSAEAIPVVAGPEAESIGDSIPARIGPYRIITLLGAGAMGRVYRGFDEQLERDVAIKVISKSLTENEHYVERFKREAKILASISHPNIALIYYFGSLDGLPYFCMEYLANGSVEDLLETQKVIDPETALSYMTQVASGLREAASKGVLHMDIKPSNLMIAEDGRVKVVDFGLAQTMRHMDDLEKNLVGTPIYIAPEQIMGGVADFRMDIYSLGITFFEMLYGFPPFKGTNVPEIFQTKLKGHLPTPVELNPNVPTKIYDLVKRMTERDPLQRISNYSELLEELELARRSISAPAELPAEIALPATGAIKMRGLIYDQPFPEILGHIAQQHLTGKLTINWGQIRKQMHFKEGRLIAFLSNQEGENFIDLLISRLPGEAREMRRLQTSQSSDLYQGYSTVVERISPEIRDRMSIDLRKHAEELLRNLFDWMTGEFIFESGEFGGQLDLEIQTQNLVITGVREWINYDVIRRRLYDGNCVIRHAADFIRLLRNLNLEPSDRFLLFRFESDVHYSNLLPLSGIPEEEFARLIYLFRCLELIHLTSAQTTDVKKDQPQPVQSSLDLATYYTHCAVKSFEQKNYWACVEYCRKSLEQKQDPNVYRLMGRALSSHVRFRDEALDAYDQALKLAPGNSGILRDIADLYFSSGKLSEARTRYERLLKQNPADQHSAKRLQEILRKLR